MDTHLLLAALMMGLTGSLHCAGMCGPIALILPFSGYSRSRQVLSLFLYHTGRISAYAGLGIVLHSFAALFHPSWQRYTSIAIGALMLTAAIVSLWPRLFPGGHFRLPWSGWVQQRLYRVTAQRGWYWPVFTGFLNGLLPCGLVYMALALTPAGSGNLEAAAVMVFFGAGTVPALVAIAVLKTRSSFLSAGRWRKWVPAVMLVMGTLFFVRGLNLGIPYLSPKIEMEEGKAHASCCHKK